MKTQFHTTEQLLKSEKIRYQPSERPEPLPGDLSPLPLSVIPNYMGTNLCSVEGISWTEQDDGQLVSLTIHFIPAGPEGASK